MSHDITQKFFFFFSFFKILSLPISTLEVFCIYTKGSGFVYLWIPECVNQCVFSSISVSCIFSGFFFFHLFHPVPICLFCYILFYYYLFFNEREKGAGPDRRGGGRS